MSGPMPDRTPEQAAGELPPIPFTPDTLAARWGCDAENVRVLCKRGRLRHFTVGRGMYRIPVQAVEEFEGCGLSSTEAGGTRSGGKAARPGAGRSVPGIVMLPPAH